MRPVAIEYREREGGTGADVVTTACPACGKDRDEWHCDSLAYHLPVCDRREEL